MQLIILWLFPGGALFIHSLVKKFFKAEVLHRSRRLQRILRNLAQHGNRIITDSNGDKVQPFAENDKNRCVIVDGEAEKVVIETVTETVNE